MKIRKPPLFLAITLASSLIPLRSAAQEGLQYSRLNSFGFTSEYANTSSHIRWGVSRKRKLAVESFEYSRRFNAPHWFNWTPYASVFYEVSIAPVAFLEDQVATDTSLDTNEPFTIVTPIYDVCVQGMTNGDDLSVPGLSNHVYERTCSTRWTYLGGGSPVGFRINLRPKSKFQPLIDSHLGFLAAHRDVPVNYSSFFNFTFEFGAGFETFIDHRRSVALEYRLHHLSNAYLGYNNPGVDSQDIAVSVRFGRSVN